LIPFLAIVEPEEFLIIEFRIEIVLLNKVGKKLKSVQLLFSVRIYPSVSLINMAADLTNIKQPC